MCVNSDWFEEIISVWQLHQVYPSTGEFWSSSLPWHLRAFNRSLMNCPGVRRPKRGPFSTLITIENGRSVITPWLYLVMKLWILSFLIRFCWQIGQDYAFSSFWIFPRQLIFVTQVSMEDPDVVSPGTRCHGAGGNRRRSSLQCSKSRGAPKKKITHVVMGKESFQGLIMDPTLGKFGKSSSKWMFFLGGYVSSLDGTQCVYRRLNFLHFDKKQPPNSTWILGAFWKKLNSPSQGPP